MKLITEKRELTTKGFRFFAPIISILVALFVAGFLLLAAGVNPKRIIITSSHTADRLHEEFDCTPCLAVIEKAEPEQQAAFMMILDSIMKR